MNFSPPPTSFKINFQKKKRKEEKEKNIQKINFLLY